PPVLAGRPRHDGRMRSASKTLSRLAVLGYSAIAYGTFVVATVWALGFLAGRGAPTSVDGRSAGGPAAPAVAVDAALLLAFAVHPSVTARPGFKRRLTRLIPAAAERSTYVLVASLLLCAVFGWWQPVPGVVWHVGQPWSAAIWVVFGL